MSKQIKIFMIVGAILIALVAGYWLLWPEGEEAASERGVRGVQTNTEDTTDE